MAYTDNDMRITLYLYKVTGQPDCRNTDRAGYQLANYRGVRYVGDPDGMSIESWSDVEEKWENSTTAPLLGPKDPSRRGPLIEDIVIIDGADLPGVAMD